MNRTSWIAVAAIAAVAAAIEWWPRPGLTPPNTPAAAEPASVQPAATQAPAVATVATVAAEPKPLQESRASENMIRAQISPLNYTTISAELAARIARLAVREGDAFSRGQVLVQFDCAAQSAQLDKAKASLQIAERNAAAQARLHELQSVSRLDADNARSEVLRVGAEVQELTTLVGRCVIRAPFAGRVGEQKARQEQFVQVGQPLLDILEAGALELEFIAPSAWMRWMRPGTPLTLAVDETGLSYTARVTRLGAQIDAVSQTVKVTGVITGQHAELKPGMSGAVLMPPPAPEEKTP